MSRSFRTVAELAEALKDLPGHLPVFLDAGGGPTPAEGHVLQAVLYSGDRFEGGPPDEAAGETADGLRALVIR